MKKLDQAFWNNRWEVGKTGWDIGYASPAIVSYFKNIEDKESQILIPGCGNAYEAEELLALGFKNITILDISSEAVKRLKEKFKDCKQIEIICHDFFEHDAQYDFIVEQTFFCALTPNLRGNYVKKMYKLLRNQGKLVGLLFNKKFNREGPPFGGCKSEYQELFSQSFQLNKIEICEDSIPQRQEAELFIEFIKK